MVTIRVLTVSRLCIIVSATKPATPPLMIASLSLKSPSRICVLVVTSLRLKIMESKLKRPNFEEDEDDLMRMQEEFNNSENKSSVSMSRQQAPAVNANKVIILKCIIYEKNTTNTKTTTSVREIPSVEKKKSIFSERIAKSKKEIQITTTPILSEVKESNFEFISKDFVRMASGFPEVHHRFDKRNQNPQKDTTPKNYLKYEIKEMKCNELIPVGLNLKEFDGVHKQNTETLDQMSATEIKEARNEITQKIDPELLDFIRNRASKKLLSSIKPKVINVESKTDDAHISTFVQKYIPPSKVEYEKLEWMMNPSNNPTEPLPIDQSDPTSFLTQTLAKFRFDFQGYRIKESTEITDDSGLHHHNDNQTSPGYTLLELQHLSRSTVPAQRSLAFNVLAHIIDRVKHFGSLDEKCNLNYNEMKLIEYFIENGGVVLGFRMALDDSFGSVVASGLQGLLSYLESNSTDSSKNK